MKCFTLYLLLLLPFSYSLHAEDKIVPFKSADDKLVCQSIAPGELESYASIIKRFNRNIVPPREKIRTETGLQNYLGNTGIKYFSAKELMTPHEESDALKCGLENLLPHQCIWPAGAAMLSIFDKVRDLIGGPILFRNWWRPTCYNELVAGAKSSDHLLAKSMDLDFKSPHDRAVAQKFVCEELWKKGVNVQVGIGCTSLHIGLGSPKGKRFWLYESVKSCPVKSLDGCWEI